MSDGVEEAKKRARQMILDGETLDKIKDETRLREKDISRIQKEISTHF